MIDWFHTTNGILKAGKGKRMRAKNPKQTEWMKPDSVANFCTMVTTRKFAHMFRFSFALKDEIDPVVLESALQVVIKRIPAFALKLRYGLFWNYMEMSDEKPTVEEDVRNPMVRGRWKLNKHLLFRVRYFGKRISLEVFHALADGTGAMKFMVTLVAEYLRQKYGYEIEESEWILHPDEEPIKEEYEDTYHKIARPRAVKRSNPKAYRTSGTQEAGGHLNIVTGYMPVNKIKAKAKEYDCTVTAFLTAVLMDAYQDIQKQEKKKAKRKLPIVIVIPVNLRKIYPSKTICNFFANVYIGLERAMGHYSFGEIVKQVKHLMALEMTEKSLNNLVAGNIASYGLPVYKFIPMIIKKPFVILGGYMSGEVKTTCTLSNLGQVVLPEVMSTYVQGIQAVAGRNFGRDTNCMGVSFQDTLAISFTRKVKESEVERLFYTKLVEMGIPVEVESNQMEEE